MEMTPNDARAAETPVDGRWDPGLYDGPHAFVWKAGADMLDLLDPKPGERILDLGCGTGHLTHAIAERGAEVLGLDASAEMISAAQQAYPGLAFRVGGAPGFESRLRLLGEASGATVRLGGKGATRTLEGRCTDEGHLEFLVPGGSAVAIEWSD